MSIKVTAKNYGTGTEHLVLEIPPYLFDEIINVIHQPIEITVHAQKVIDRWRNMTKELDRRHNLSMKQRISRLVQRGGIL